MNRVTPKQPVAPARPLNDVTRPVVPMAPIAPSKPASTPAREATIAKLRALVAAESKLSLQAGTQTRLFLHEGNPPRGTLVMYHGLTAGTWQFEILAKQAYEQGYDVIVPRMPGHGFKDAQGVEDPSQLPTTKDWNRYTQFGEETYQLAKGLGGAISVLGLSVGANVALSVAEQHNDIGRVVAYAPFLRPPGLPGRVADALLFLDKVSFGWATRFVGKLPWGWGKETEAMTAAGTRPGHAKFPLGAILAAATMGQKLVKDGPKASAPIQFFVTDIDDAADVGTIRKLHDRAGGDPRNGWHRYTKAEAIPHAMAHPNEDAGRGHTPALYADTLKFLETGLPQDVNEL